MTVETTPLENLRSLCGGAVRLPGDPGYDEARSAWAAAIDQRPAAVAFPASAEEVAAVVRAARTAGLRVAPQGTGHNAGPLGDLGGTLLLRTSAMTGVQIDPDRRTARVQAGALWQDVVEAAAEHGLYALHGSSPDVGVVGYSLGGGLGWLARSAGLQCNRLTAVELVTADGVPRRVDADHDPELFWALRGGGGGFGVVTAVEFELLPSPQVYGGMLAWDWRHAAPVLHRWSQWSALAPDEVTTSFRFLQLPPIEEVPEPLRGRSVVAIDGAVLGDPEHGERLLAPLRELNPEFDMFGPMPAAALTRIHGDPEGPTPSTSAHGMLRALPAEAVVRLLEVAGQSSGSQLMMVELRQLGGAVGRPAPGGGALDHLDGAYALFAGSIAPTPEAVAAVEAAAAGVVEAMRPWSSGSSYLNFSEHPVDTASAYGADAYARLRRIRDAVDPDRLLHANHEI